MKATLLVTASFYVCWAFWVLGWPAQSLAWSGLSGAGAKPLWGFTGLVDLVIAGGLVAASVKPCQYWPVTSVCLALHSAATCGFALGVRTGELSLASWPAVMVHDAIWCIPLALVLHGVHCTDSERRSMGCQEVQGFALRTKTQYGVSIEEMSNLSPVLVVFMRHLACPFSQESIADLAGRRKAIEKHGSQIALVHMSSDAEAAPILARHGLDDLPRVSDPNLSVYHAFGLRQTGMHHFLSPKLALRLLHAVAKYGVRKALSVSHQMPGAFFIFHGEVLRSYRHQSPADRADLLALVTQQDYPIAS